DSEVDTTPEAKSGQLVQQRNFFNPELDAKLAPYLSGLRSGPLSWLAPDDFSFRAAGWGFYDGIFDYGTRQYGANLDTINPHFPNYNAGQCAMPPHNACNSNADCGASDVCMPRGGWFMRGQRVISPQTMNPDGSTIPPGQRFVDNLDQVLPGAGLEN